MSSPLFSRRHFMKNLGAGSLTLAAASPLSLLTGCSSAISSSQSYMHKIVSPQNNNAVFHWTDVMLQSVRNQSYNPPRATRCFAMAHLAGFLAVNAIEKKYYTPYPAIEVSGQADPEIAYGVAMSYALEEGFQSVFMFDRLAFLAKFEDNAVKDVSVKIGKMAADIVVKERINDGAEPNKAEFYLGRYPKRDDALAWSPTGPFYGAKNGPAFNTFNRGALPGWGAQKPWVMRRKQAFLVKDFPDARSPEFAAHFKKVKELGAANSAIRTEDQTQIAFFWEDGPRGVTPPGHWQLIAMNILQSQRYSILELARAFALISLGQADAAITTWDSKYHHDILRPETAIRHRSEEFGNPQIAGQGDKGWQSLIPTPNFPAYTSGHSTFSAVSARVLALFLGTDSVRFSSRSPDLVNWPSQLTDVTRSYTSLSHAAKEGSASREYGGIHWVADAAEGMKCGYSLGDYIYNNAFKRAV